MADCGILAIASTTQTIHALLQRLVKDLVFDQHASTVPWTIANKYYTAEVKFLVHSLSALGLLQNELLAPALLFAWNRGEPYRDQIRKLAQCTSQHEFEVSLAIRLSPSDAAGPGEIEDDQDVDIYLSSQGFEFVDVPDVEVPLPDRMAAPGIPRIIDALSTIMWPSMIRRTSKSITTSGFIGATQTYSGASGDYHNLVQLVGARISGSDSGRMQRELEELERWLDKDMLPNDTDERSAVSDDNDAIPWSTAVTPGTLSPSLSSSGFLESSRPTTPKTGFDDDFTSFVSAEPASIAGVPLATLPSLSFAPLASTRFSSTFSFHPTSSGRTTPVSCDQPMVLGKSYESLGSMSDLGDPGRELVHLERLSTSCDGDGEDMPTQAEIAETSRRIFGGAPLSLSPTQERGDGSHQPQASLDEALRGEVIDAEMTDADLEQFDLQSVLGALQGLKEEIAGMPDEERRKAAARVALGLAYGLGSSPHSEASKELA